MAWSTCQYCQKKENGWGNMDHHQREKHRTEYRIAEAQKQVGWAEERLAKHIKDMEEYETLDRVLAQNLPDLVVTILTKERDKRLVKWYLKGEEIVTSFDEQIADDAAYLAQKRAELAVLQPTEVPA